MNTTWFNAPPIVERQDESIYGLSLLDRDCRIRDNIPVHGVGLLSACVTEGSRMRIAYHSRYVLVSIGRDQNFYPLNTSSFYLVLNPETDRLMEYNSTGVYSSTFSVYENASSHFKFASGQYTFQPSTPIFQHLQPTYFAATPRMSRNGDFIAYLTVDTRVGEYVAKIVDLTKKSTTGVGYVQNLWAYSRENYRNIAVSNHGKYIAINTLTEPVDGGDVFRAVQVWKYEGCNSDEGVECISRVISQTTPSREVSSVWNSTILLQLSLS